MRPIKEIPAIFSSTRIVRQYLQVQDNLTSSKNNTETVICSNQILSLL